MSEDVKVVKKAAEEKPTRKERLSITGTRTKLALSGEEPGFHYAWINEENVGHALDCSFEYVTHAIKVGNQHIDVSKLQGSKIARNVGGGVTAYLMRIPQEFYDFDMAEEQRVKVDELEKQVFIDVNSNGLSGKIERGWDVNTDLKYK